MAMQIFAEKVKLLWNEWELRAFVLISLTLQGVLLFAGKSRKCSANIKIRFVLWLAYLSADAVATFSLGVLSNKQGEIGNDSTTSSSVIMALWAPFLLLHLGGPDTITAYSLEDNELWRRHLLGLIVQVGGAIYICVRSWSRTWVNWLAIPVFIAGIIKYGERVWVLRSASSDQFRESLLPSADPGPNYARYMEEYSIRKEEGFKVISVIDTTVFDESTPERGNSVGRSSITQTEEININDAELLQKAETFFKTSKRLCADLILSFHDIEISRSFFRRISSKSDEAFKVIEFELGFMYDEFYTKLAAVLVDSPLTIFLRFASFFSTVSAFLVFCFIGKQSYSSVDVVISYVLFIGAIILETCAATILLRSDRTVLWLSKTNSFLIRGSTKLILMTSSWAKKKRWSNTMAQYNHIRFCLKERPPKCLVFQKMLVINELLEKYRYIDTVKVPQDLKELIFLQLIKKSKDAKDSSDFKKLCAQKGVEVLQKYHCFEKIGWSTNEDLDLDESILLWHIATELCYLSDLDINSNFVTDKNCRSSKLLSDYMLYLLVVCPFMLPNGIGQIRFRDTCAEAEEFFKERKRSITTAKEASKVLMDICTKVKPLEVKGDSSKSVLFEACILAHDLQSLEQRWNKEKKWKVIRKVWVEMLAYAANHCSWSQHAKQLRRGGELLTHIWLLMAHLGITEQFQISKGHARAKLNLQ